jgi:hypothetical protein
MVPPSEADRAQADIFCEELHRQIALLDEQRATFRAEMARYSSGHRLEQVKRMQRELRTTALERRKLLDLVAGLGHRYPCDHHDPGPRGPDGGPDEGPDEVLDPA